MTSDHSPCRLALSGSALSGAAPSYGLVSYHGCHSGEFCLHARDTLESMVRAYIEKGFTAIGITEHMPPPADRFRYADEAAAGLSAADLYRRFGNYCRTVRTLRETYRKDITIFLAFETESYTGYREHVARLIREFTPDYILGSVHHVKDVCFDYSADDYRKAVRACRGIDNLYHAYFDLQHDMIDALEPSVVAHFDIIRIHDPDYAARMIKPDIMKKITRNLDLVRKKDLILDYNMRALAKGAAEPYICRPILERAKEMNIKIAPGEDSHSIDDIGRFIGQGVRRLADMGFDLEWPVPRLIHYPKDPQEMK